ncbi:MAG TPA: hypothetical protein DGG94_10240 [Micromonosporaceae bacterium]|nr:hypothetical protein [Micromonosporaceae bacterium]HCU50161.1 hypothetical protein [Micromonosporaceae bacterium]
MLILLPPSEGKTVPKRGKPLDLETLSLPTLNPFREQVLDALIALRGEQAREVLGLSEGQLDEVSRNKVLRTAPTAAAAKVYTGVLYESLDLATLSPPARRLMKRSLLIFSGLWGVVGIGDRIPAYRCSVGVNLPGVGTLGPFWRKALPPSLGDGHLVVDLRSGPYAAMWPVSGNHVVIRVLHGGKVVSHFNKATKGRLVRDLAMAGLRPKTVPALVSALRELKYTVEVDGPRVDVIVTEL